MVRATDGRRSHAATFVASVVGGAAAP